MKPRKPSNPSPGAPLGWGLLLVVALLPLVISPVASEHVSPRLTGLASLESNTYISPFNGAKYFFLLITTAVLAVAFTRKVWNNPASFTASEAHLPLAILWIGALLSQLFSPYPSIALHGMYNVREGTLAFLCYLFLMLVATHTANPRKPVFFVYALIPYVAVEAVVGLLAFSQINLLQLSLVKRLLLGNPSAEFNHFFLTVLGNQNYASGFGAICTIISLTLALISRSPGQRLIMSGLSLLAFSIVLTSLSRSGFLTFIAMLPIVLVVAWKYGHPKQTVKVGAATLSAFVILYLILWTHNQRVWDETVGVLIAPVHQTNDLSSPPPDENPGQSARPARQSEELPMIAPEGLSWGSGRGFYWNHTLSLISQRPWLGHGFDTIAYTFPQHHPEKRAGLGSALHTVNKPHSLYLGLAYGAGVPFLLAFLFLALSILGRHVVALWKGIELSPEHISIALGCLSYLIQGTVNDSHIGYSAVFWIFLGMSSNFLRVAIERHQMTPRQQ